MINKCCKEYLRVTWFKPVAPYVEFKCDNCGNEYKSITQGVKHEKHNYIVVVCVACHCGLSMQQSNCERREKAIA